VPWCRGPRGTACAAYSAAQSYASPQRKSRTTPRRIAGAVGERRVRDGAAAARGRRMPLFGGIRPPLALSAESPAACSGVMMAGLVGSREAAAWCAEGRPALPSGK